MSRTQRKRKTYRSADGTEFVPVTVKLPMWLFRALQKAIRSESETDQTKFVRKALRERVLGCGIPCAPDAEN